MARTISEIKTELQTEAIESMGLSSSATAEWMLWISVFALGIHLFEVVMDVFRKDVEEKIHRQEPGTLAWYGQLAKQFQYGDTLQVSDAGVLAYPLEDAETQIVAHVSVVEIDGGVDMKVAKLDEEGELVSLDLLEGLEFRRYIDQVRFAGTTVDVTILSADLLKYDIEVYYDPAFDAATVQEAVSQALSAFRLTLPFNAQFYTSDLNAALLPVLGVKSIKINGVEAHQGEDVEQIDVVYTVKAGYFNWHDESTLTMTVL